VTALSTAQLVIVPLACKDIYLDRYAQPDKGLTDRDESRHLVPYWYVDTGFTALLILLAVTNEGLGASFFGFDSRTLPGFRAQFGVPAEWMPIGAIAIGHPDPGSDPIPPARASERKPLTELVHRGRWCKSALPGPAPGRSAATYHPARSGIKVFAPNGPGSPS
jgi:nitroreductase